MVSLAVINFNYALFLQISAIDGLSIIIWHIRFLRSLSNWETFVVNQSD